MLFVSSLSILSPSGEQGNFIFDDDFWHRRSPIPHQQSTRVDELRNLKPEPPSLGVFRMVVRQTL